MSSLLIGLLVAGGCNRSPQAVPRPKLDFAQAAKAAISAVDTDNDGAVTMQEAESAPGLASTFKLADVDGNGILQEKEIEQRLRAMVENSPALVGVKFEIDRGGQPLENAVVEIVPEPFLGDAFKSASATTDDLGMAYVSLSEADLPFPGAPPGVRCGLYRVKITSPSEPIPAKFNEATTIGLDVSNDSMTLRTSSVRISID
jgi:hypothetical protein